MSLLHKKTAAPGLPEGAAAHGKAGFFRSSPFRRGLLIYIAALAAVLAVLLTVLWQFLRAYERSVPLSAARAYLSSLDGEALTCLSRRCRKTSGRTGGNAPKSSSQSPFRPPKRSL